MENLSIIMKYYDDQSISFLSIIMKYYDDQSISLSNADVNFIVDVQKREELLVQPIPGATMNCNRSTEIAEKHSAAAITMETVQAEVGDNYPMFESGYSTVLTNSICLFAGKLRSM